MPLPDDLTQHPSPAEVYEMAVDYAALLRALYGHPSFRYLGSPNAQESKLDVQGTPPALFWVADFVQNSYIKHIIPYLPQGATRKCKEIGNPWAYVDPDYKWELTWDAGSGALKDAAGNAVAFPKFGNRDSQLKLNDIIGRGVITKKLVFENETDMKAQLLIGGQSFDFGDEVKKAAERIP